MNTTHRSTIPILLSAAAIAIWPSFCHAQAPAAPASPSISPLVSTNPSPTANAAPDQMSSDQKFLAQKVTLTEGSKVFYVTRKSLGFLIQTGPSNPQISVDPEILQNYLLKIKPRVDSSASPAHPVLDRPAYHPTRYLSDNTPRPAKVVPAEASVSLLVNESMATITQAVSANPSTPSFPLQINTGSLAANSADLTGIDARISHFVTHFDPYEVGRTQTVKRAIALCDGYVLEPGQIFSINGVVGERTAARGFGIGKVFIDGTMQDQLGGGMCQVATTLYNAALLANLKIVERHQHARTVPYVPAGGDATVYYGQKDFQFQNNTNTPIYISYRTVGDYCVADLYGKAEPDVKVQVVTTPTRLGPRYYKGVLRRYVTIAGKTTNDYTSLSSYKWTPALDYVR